MFLAEEIANYLKRIDNSNSGNIDILDRLKAEIQFAGMLSDAGFGTGEWPGLIDKAVKSFIEDVKHQIAPSTALAKAEKIMASIGKAAKKYTIHCIGHAHIDMDWVWPWPETVALTNDTFLTVLKLMEEFPDFYFTQSQGSIYQIIKDVNPELLERIKARVKEGRWEVAATQWVEGDKNMASGESLARHLLYTRKFMRQNLDLAPEDVQIDWEPDTFGFAATIPGILARGKVTGCLLNRTGVPARPPIFFWEGPDGSRVLNVRCTADLYPARIGTNLTKFLVDFKKESGLNDWVYLYGIGDHGGGPTRRDIMQIRDMDFWPVYPNFKMTTARNYFELIAKEAKSLPVVKGELNCEFVGCYSSQSLIKRANRYGENLLLEAEYFASLAGAVAGSSYPAEKLEEGWKKILFGQFHDILPGSGIPETRLRNQGLFQEVCASVGMIRTNALRALTALIDTAGVVAQNKEFSAEVPAKLSSTAIGGGAGRGSWLGGLSQTAFIIDGPRPFVLFNPTAWMRREIVQFTVWDTDTGKERSELAGKSFVVRTPDGKAIQAQKLGQGDFWGHNYVDLAFPAEAPAAGYRTYVVTEGIGVSPDPVKGSEYPLRHMPYMPRATGMENEFLKVRFDEYSGGIVELIDKTTGADLACAESPMGVLEYGMERPRGMTAWTPGSIYRSVKPLEVKSQVRLQNGPYIISLENKMEFEQSRATVVYTLKTGQPWVDVQVKLSWFQRGSQESGIPVLRMLFPSNLTAALLTAEVPYGSITRGYKNGEEVPSLRWVDLAGQTKNGKQGGLALLNDCKYGHALDGSLLSLTLVRATYDPDPLPEIGEHTINLAVVPHGKTLSKSELTQLGAAFNHPLIPVAAEVHGGSLAPVSSDMFSVKTEGVLISNVKRAETDKGLIISLFNTAGTKRKAEIVINRDILGKVKEAVEVDMLEEETLKNSAKTSKNGLSVDISAFGIARVKIFLD